MILIHSPRYHIDLGLHVFPTAKYRKVMARLLDAHIVSPEEVIEPAPASWDELRLVHTAEYLEKMRTGTLERDEIAQLELPWSPEMVEGFRLMLGGTIDAARIACGVSKSEVRRLKSEVRSAKSEVRSAKSEVRNAKSDVVCHVGGGLHHAFPNHGEGFCPFNDVAVAVRVLQEHGIERVAIVDLDVHHGNGTAFIFNPRGDGPEVRRAMALAEPKASAGPGPSADPDAAVFTFSMHQQHNYPLWKPRGSLDVGLSDGTHDATYLCELEKALPQVFAHDPGCIFYLAGADPYEDDQLGGLRLTKDGLRRRDRLVIDAARSAGVPLVIVLAGGYAQNIDDTVDIHCATIEEAGRSTSGSGR